jgi:two-component system, cell cycle sensor histidine kinase and response regulator CckA
MPDEFPPNDISRMELSLDEFHPQLQRLQRAEVVGALAAGIAHEFNNLLLAVRGNLSLALMMPDLGGTAAERLRQADAAAARASELSQRLMNLARPATDKAGIIDFNQVAHEASQVATRAWRGRIALDVRPAPKPVSVWMDFSQAVQAILALCLNAGEAFVARAPGGLVTVSNDLVRLDSVLARQAGGAGGGEFVCCTVADNGPGLGADVKGRLFTPFFTTKPQGTGLGLVMTMCTAQRAGGWVEAENQPGGGAAFRVFLPVHSDPKSHLGAEKNLDAQQKRF